VPRGVAHPPELRAQAVAAVLAGSALAEVARRYGISKGTLGTWLAESEVRTVRTPVARARTRDELAALIYDAVAATLRSLTARAEATGRADWIEKQSAAELAQLAATDWDRIIRMVSGFRPVEPSPAGLPTAAAAAPGTAGDDQ